MAHYNQRRRRATPRKKKGSPRASKSKASKTTASPARASSARRTGAKATPPKRPKTPPKAPPKRAPKASRKQSDTRATREREQRAAEAAASRAKAKLESARKPRTKKETAALERSAKRVRGLLERAGFSPQSVSAQLAWVERKRAARTKKRAEPSIAKALAALQKPARKKTAKERAKLDARKADYRKALERAGFAPKEIASKLGWVSRRQSDDFRSLAKVRLLALGGIGLDARRPADRVSLEAHLPNGREGRGRSRELEAFLEYAYEELDIDYETAIDEWFSPSGD